MANTEGKESEEVANSTSKIKSNLQNISQSLVNINKILSASSMVKSLGEANKQIQNITTNTKNSSKELKNLTKETDNVNKSIKTTGETIEKTFKTSLPNALSKLKDTFSSIGEMLFGFKSALDATTMIKNIITANKELYRISINAGQGEEGFRKLNGATLDLQKNLGAIREDAVKLVKTLGENQYLGNLKYAAETSYSFARATGLSYEGVAELTNNLSKAGGLGDKAISTIYADMLKVQQANGLTRKGMDAVTKSITNSAVNMRAFGKSDDAIKAMSKNTARLVSEMEKVGIAADKTTALIERLTDPTKLEKNIALYSQLGISISDALSGEDITGQIEANLPALGQKLKDMGPIAGAAYAEAIGIDYKEAIKAANAELAEETGPTNEEQSLQALKELTENTKHITEKIQDIGNKFVGMLYEAGPVVIGLFALVGSILSSMISDIVDSTITKLSSGIQESIENGGVTAENIVENTLKSAQTELYNALENAGNKLEAYKKDLNDQAKALIDSAATATKDAAEVLMKKAKEIGKEIKNAEADLSKIEKAKESMTASGARFDEKKATDFLKTNRSSEGLGMNSDFMKNKGVKSLGGKDLKGLMKSMKGLGGKIGGLGGKLGKLGSTFGKVGGIFGKVGGVFGKMFGVISKVVPTLLKFLGPIGIIISVVTMLIKLIKKAFNNPEVKKAMAEMKKAFAEVKKAYNGFLKPIVNVVAKILGGIIKAITTVISKISEFIRMLPWVKKGEEENEAEMEENKEALEENTEALVEEKEQQKEKLTNTKQGVMTSGEYIKDTTNNEKIQSTEVASAEVGTTSTNNAISSVKASNEGTVSAFREVVLALKSEINLIASMMNSNTFKVNVENASSIGGNINNIKNNGFYGSNTWS